jgi:septal ring factor EnvC (AmiA/AmiB activator)
LTQPKAFAHSNLPLKTKYSWRGGSFVVAFSIASKLSSLEETLGGLSQQLTDPAKRQEGAWFERSRLSVAETERRIGMKRWKLALLFLFACGALIVQPGCSGSKEQKAELEKVKTALQATEQQRDALKTEVAKLDESLNRAESELADVTEDRDSLKLRLGDLEEARTQLRSKTEELAASRDALQMQVEDLKTSRSQLQSQVDELKVARDAALLDAKKAQNQIDMLNSELQAQAQQVSNLGGQITAIKAVLAQLQKKLQ